MSFITAAGVVGFSNQITRAAPNNIVPVSYFIATGLETNIDIALGPKGNGAISADIPDNAAAGGNKRGNNAVDWQTSRSGATQVAGGSGSVISGGIGNTIATGAGASVVGGGSGNNVSGGGDGVISGGSQNSVSQTNGAIGGGNQNTVSGTRGVVGGGIQNTASGQDSVVVGGSSNTASGDFSTAIGRGASTRGIRGMVASSAKILGAAGDTQKGEYQLLNTTLNATPAPLTADGFLGTASASNIPILPNNSTFKFSIDVVGSKPGTSDYLAVKFEGVVTRGASAASTTIIAPGTAGTDIARSVGAAAWVVALTAETTLGGLLLTVTGPAATMNWSATVTTKEVVG